MARPAGVVRPDPGAWPLPGCCVCCLLPLPTGLASTCARQTSSTLQVMPGGAITPGWNWEQLEAVQLVLDGGSTGWVWPNRTLQNRRRRPTAAATPREQDPNPGAKVLGSTALLEFPSRGQGTARRCRGLCYRYKRQARGGSWRASRAEAAGSPPRLSPPGQEPSTAAPAFPSEELWCRPDQPRGSAPKDQ